MSEGGQENGCGWGPSWSADGRSLVYLLSNHLKTVDVGTGAEHVLVVSSAEDLESRTGVARNEQGTVLIGGRRLQRLSPGVQGPRAVVTSDPSVMLQVWPSFLANGRDFVFAQKATDPAQQGIFLGSLDTNRAVRLVPHFSNAVLAPSGHLVFGRDGVIVAQRFNPDTRSVEGEPTAIVRDVTSRADYTHFAVGADRTLVYVPADAKPTSELVWYDRRGSKLGTLGPRLPYRQIVMAPDGRRAVVEGDSNDSGANPPRFLLLDLVRGTTVAANGAVRNNTALGDAVWSPDGQRLVFAGLNNGDVDLFVANVDSSEPPAVLAHLPLQQYPEQWSADGRFILYSQIDSATKVSLWALPLEGDRKPILLVDAPFLQDEVQLSPDGRWLTYVSYESGRAEVYLQPFGRPGVRSRISTAGGGQPKWRADGREVFYVALDGTVMAVPFPITGDPGDAQPLFPTTVQSVPYLDQVAATPDGQKFLVISPVSTADPARLAVIENWPALIQP